MKSIIKLFIQLIIVQFAMMQCTNLKHLDTSNFNKDKLSKKLVSLYGSGDLVPTQDQWKVFLSHEEFSDKPVVILDIIKFKENTATGTGKEVFEKYLLKAKTKIDALGGEVLFRARADHGLIGKDSAGWSQAVFISYPSRAAYIDMLLDPEYKSLHELRNSSLKRVQQFATDAGPFSTPRFLANLIYSAVEIKSVTLNADQLSKKLAKITTDPLYEPTAKQWKKLIKFPGFLNAPYVNLNLTRIREKAKYTDGKNSGLTGIQAYKKYGDGAAPLLVARRGWPLLVGKVEQFLTGKNDPKWDSISFVKWPSRAAIVDMALDPKYVPEWEHRKAGVSHAIAIATTIIEEQN